MQAIIVIAVAACIFWLRRRTRARSPLVGRKVRLWSLAPALLLAQCAPECGPVQPPPPPLEVHPVDQPYPTGLCDDQLPGLNNGTANVVEIGRSVQGRPIYAEKHGNGPKAIVVVSQIHGNECAPQLVAEAVRASLWENATVWLIPTLNPDGYANHTRANANNRDLNRDGYAMAEPESRALRDFVDRVHPVLTVHVHSPSNYAGYYGPVGGFAHDFALAYANSVNIRFRGLIANSSGKDAPFLWKGHAGDSIIVEVPAVTAVDAVGATDNPTSDTVERVRSMAAVLVSMLRTI